jgi:hypothetical protein
MYHGIIMSAKKSGKGGRPPKFASPRRPITVTLPDYTLRKLQAMDPDRARAIVKVVEAVVPDSGGDRQLVEVVEVAPGVGIILVGPSFYLQRIPWLRLVEVAPGRFLLSIPSGTSLELFELTLLDLGETVPSSEAREHSIVAQLSCLLRKMRLGRTVTKAEMLLVDMGALQEKK